MVSKIQGATSDAAMQAGHERRRRGVLIGLGSAAVVVLIVAVIVATGVFRDPPPPIPPTVDDILVALDRQAAALVEGDEAGWLAPVRRTDPGLVNKYRALYRKLREFGVTSLNTAVAEWTLDAWRKRPSPVADLVVSFGFCAQVPICPKVMTDESVRRQSTESFSATMRWTVINNQFLVETFEIEPSPPGGRHRMPWLDTELQVMAGSSVIVAASADLASRLPAVVSAGNAAAFFANRYARWVTPVHYVVYLANPDQWKTWFAGTEPRDTRTTLGVAVQTSRSSDVVILNVALIDSEHESFESVLRHEFGHVVTLLGSQPETSAGPLLIEGIAEYVHEQGRPVSDYRRLDNVRQFLRSGKWSGDLDDIEPYFYGDLREVNIMYGFGYLTWRCIDATYGMKKVFDFAGHALRQEDTIYTAAQAALGTSWAAVKQTCAKYIRTVAR